MNELDLLRDLGTELDPPEAPPPAALRRRALAHGARPARATRRPWHLAIACGLAVAVTLALYLTGAVPAGNPPGTPGGRSPTGTSPVVRVEAARILHNAALTAASQKAASPRADQFVFTESLASDVGAVEQPDGTARQETGPPRRSQVWASVDGIHDGLMRTRPESDPAGWSTDPLPGCRDGRMDSGGGYMVACTPGPAYRADMPSDPDAMLRWLYANSQGDNQRTEQAFITAGDLLDGSYLTPDVEAALFEALAQLPGVTVKQNLVDLAGRRGVGIGMGHLDPSNPAGGRAPTAPSSYLIFDAHSYAFLGSSSATLVRRAIVDRPGQLP